MSLNDFDLFLSSMEDVKPLKHDTVQFDSTKQGPSLAQQEKRKAAECDLAIDENYLRSEFVCLLQPTDPADEKKRCGQ